MLKCYSWSRPWLPTRYRADIYSHARIHDLFAHDRDGNNQVRSTLAKSQPADIFCVILLRPRARSTEEVDSG